MTFNILSGRSLADGRIDVDRYANAVAGLGADILALQEVDRGQPRSGGHDLAAVAAEAMGAAHHVFAPSLYGTPGERWTAAGAAPPSEGPAYGCALVSRYPMRLRTLFHTPAPPVALPLWAPGPGFAVVREEPRVAIVAEIDTPAAGTITAVATHLPFVPGWKQVRLRRLVRAVADLPGPLLLLGDLNLRASAAARISGYRSLSGGPPTFPSPRPRFALDHVLLRGDPRALGAVRSVTTPAVGVSDHRPLVVEVG